MKILLVGNYPVEQEGVFQGPMRVLHSLAAALSKNAGIEVVVAVPHRLREFWKRPVMVDGTGPAAVRFSVLSFVRYLLLDRSIDVVNIHGISLFNTIGLIRRIFRRSRVFYTAHGFTPLEIPLGYRYSALSRMSERFLLRFSDGIVAVCEDTRIAMCKDLRIPILRTRVIGNGVDGHKFCPGVPRNREYNGPETANILFVGDGVRGKGVDLLLEAAERLRPGHFVLRMAGRDSDFFQKLRHDFKPLFDGGRIRYLGALDQAELLEEYRKSDFCVFPSRYDQYPQAVLEAMAMGKPVIISDRMGIRSSLESDREGFVIRSESVDELAEAMGRLIRDRTLRSKMGRRARERAETLDWARISEKYLDLFRGWGRGS